MIAVRTERPLSADRRAGAAGFLPAIPADRELRTLD
jgi:hypothetical protein